MNVIMDDVRAFTINARKNVVAILIFATSLGSSPSAHRPTAYPYGIFVFV